MGWWNKIFNKNDKKMDATPEQLEQIKMELSKYTKFQWIKGELVNNTAKLKDVVCERGLIFVEFENGSRINYALMDEYIYKAGSENDVLEIGPDQKQTAVAKVNSATITPIKKESPIYALLKKQKTNIQSIDISLSLNLPTLELYKVLRESFDNSDKEIVEYIVADLSIDVIKNAVKDAITNFYEQKI